VSPSTRRAVHTSGRAPKEATGIATTTPTPPPHRSPEPGLLTAISVRVDLRLGSRRIRQLSQWPALPEPPISTSVIDGSTAICGIDAGDATLDGQRFHRVDSHLQSDMESGCRGWHLESGHAFGTIVNDNTTGTGPNQFTYSSGWTASSCSSCYNSDSHSSSTTGATATIAFTGTRILLYSAYDTSSGSWASRCPTAAARL